MRNLVLSMLVVLGTTGLGMAQQAKTKSCTIADKKACGPGNTKKAEAKVITELKQELEQVRKLVAQNSVALVEVKFSSSDLKSLPLDIENNTEDAAIWSILMEVQSLRQSVLKESVQAAYHNKAQLVADLTNDLVQIKDRLH